MFVQKKKGNIFCWVQWNPIYPVHMHITPRIELLLFKSWNVLLCWGRWLSDGWIEKSMFHENIGAFFLALCSKMYVHLDFLKT